jgi:ParB/RepB/Spo0J family partition protein
MSVKTPGLSKVKKPDAFGALDMPGLSKVQAPLSINSTDNFFNKNNDELKAIARDASNDVEVSDVKSLVTNWMHVDKLKVWPGNPRHVIDKEKLDSLITSIIETGQQQAIDVIPDENDPTMYQIIGGQRRWHAIKDSGHNNGNILVRIRTDLTSLEDIYAAAIAPQRTTEPLLDIDLAISLAKQKDNIGVRELARASGKNAAEVSKLRQMGSLPDSLLSIFMRAPQKFSYSFGYEVVQLFSATDEETANVFANEILSNNYSLKKTSLKRDEILNGKAAKQRSSWSTIHYPEKHGTFKMRESTGEISISMKTLSQSQLKAVRDAIEKILSES